LLNKWKKGYPYTLLIEILTFVDIFKSLIKISQKLEIKLPAI
jgi:hypothetical protein